MKKITLNRMKGKKIMKKLDTFVVTVSVRCFVFGKIR